MKVFGEIEERYVEEAAPVGRAGKAGSRAYLVKWGAAAAGFVMAAVFCAGILQFRNKDDIAALENGETITFVKSDMAEGSIQMSSDLDVLPRELTGEELDRLFPNLPVTAYAYFNGSGNRLVGLEGRIGNIKLVVSTSGFQLLDTIIEGSEGQSEVNGVPVTAGYFITRPNSRGKKTVIYYASFEMGSCSIYVENAGAEHERENVKNELANIIETLINNGELDLPEF